MSLKRKNNEAAFKILKNLTMLPTVIKVIKCETPSEVTYFEVVEDVADERDVADPLVQRALSHLLAVLELLLETIQQVPPENVSVALLGLGLHRETERGQTKAMHLFVEETRI